jgi:hypothetical protein
MDFEIGAVYQTPYGRAKAFKLKSKRVNTRTVCFVILQVSAEALALGYQNGAPFLAHPEDATEPRPSTWPKL